MQNKKKTGGVRSKDRVRVRVRRVRVRDRDSAGGECIILFEKHSPPPKKKVEK